MSQILLILTLEVNYFIKLISWIMLEYYENIFVLVVILILFYLKKQSPLIFLKAPFVA